VQPTGAEDRPAPADDVGGPGRGVVGSRAGLEDDHLPAAGLRISKVATLGNKIDLDEADLLEYFGADPQTRDQIIRRAGVMYQSGALWSSMTLTENISLPLELYTDLSPGQIREVVELKLALVGMAGFGEFYPSEISGGMQKRAGIARAMALDPEILFFDEPSAGLDPVSARRLDDLILELRESLGTTMVIVTHELASIFAIGSNSVFLDVSKRTMTATGNPNQLLAETRDPDLRLFLTRGEKS